MDNPRSSSHLVSALLIEHDLNIVTALRPILSELKECSFQVWTTYKEIPEKLRVIKPELVLFSHGPPGREGVEVLTRIHNLSPHAILILSLPSLDADLINAYQGLPVHTLLYKHENYPGDFRIAVRNVLNGILLPTIGSPGKAQELLDSSNTRSKLSAFSVGETVLHYRVVDTLGKGGMGEVYRAEDLRLDRHVAIKVLPLKVIRDKVARKRLIREARSASGLNHPNIVTIHAVEEAKNLIFIVMEYVEGEDLKERIDRGPLKMAEVLDIGLQITDALDAAHDAGIIHRDLKPHNIMLSPRGQVKLLDFGLAKKKLIPSEGALQRAQESAELTATGTPVGTVLYMSPEQARGEELDRRTDIFSLGCVLYQAATGQVPFNGSNLMKIMHEIMLEDPPAPSSIRKDLPGEFDLMLRRALAKERKNRFASASQFGDAIRELKQIVSESSGIKIRTQVSTTGRTYRLRSSRKKSVHSIAVLPFTNISADPHMDYLGYGLTENLLNRLSELPNLRVVPRSTVFRYSDTQLDTQEIGNELNVRFTLTGRVLQHGETLNIQTELVDVTTNSQLWGTQLNRKLSDIIQLQEEIAQEITAKLRLRLSGKAKKRLVKRYTDNTKAYHSYLKGLYYSNRRTQEGLLKALECFREGIAEDPLYALPHAGIADCYNLLGTYGFLPPKDCFPLAKAAAINALEIDDRIAEAHTSLASVERNYEWNWKAAEEEYRRAIDLNANYPVAHQWFADLLITIGRTDEGIAEMQRALALDPLSLVLITAMGRQFYYLRQYDLALQHYRQAIDLDPSFGLAYLAMGYVLKENGMLEEAVAVLEKAVRHSNRDPTMLGSLAHLHAVSGEHNKVDKLLEEIRSISDQQYVMPFVFAVVYAGLRDEEEVMRWLEKAYLDRSVWLVWLAVEPTFDFMREDPRFTDLLKRLALR